ncbi:unnamed protein product [Urochloa humidicola]
MENGQRLRLLALLTFMALRSNTCSSSTSDNELRALMAFKSSIKDPLGALSSWNTISNTTFNGTNRFCGWRGVTCSGRVVIALRLRRFGLVGTISQDLGNLTHLSTLDLSNNKLEGAIPPSVANCFMLQRLNLSTNSLSGIIPSSLGHLSKLAVFSIESNTISGPIPSSFTNLTALTKFSIFHNSIQGKIPLWLGNCTGLTYFNIGDNMMSGHIPSVLSKLTYLQHFGVAENTLEGNIHPSLFNMSSLEVFNVGNNKLSGSLPPDMGFTLPKLRDFSAFNNTFEGPIPDSLSNMSVLERLVLYGNRFRGKIPPNIGINGLLTHFDVANNEVQAAERTDWDFLTSLVNCSNLVSIDLVNNNLSGTLPNTIANLSQELEIMWFGGNQIAGHIPAGIGRYYKLTELVLADNLFTGTIPSDIGKLSGLQELWLEQNAFHGNIPLSLGNMTQLNLLDLSANNLDGIIPAAIGKLGMLASIDLSNNLLSGQIPQEIVSISSLTQLFDLSKNALSGPIPPQVGHLVNLGIMDLSSNKLSGEIPSTLGNCIELRFLYLQGNLLRAQIPNDLSALKGLEVLDLSDNKLSGPIPEFLENFQLLSSLNLSFNQFSGPVPNKGIFFNESSVSLASNGVLCGGPPFFHFPECPSPVHDSPSRHRLTHTLTFTVVGAFSFVIICIVTCYYIKKLKASQVGYRDQGNTFIPVMYQRITYAELSAATDSFSAENLIGRGNFGSVYKGTRSCGVNSINVAVKVLNLQQRGASQSFMSECNALKRIQHRKLVKVITLCDSLDRNGDEFKALVLEFVSNGSMDKWLHPSTERKDKLSLVQRLSIALDVAEALEYLHHCINPSIVHCDIKPSNILLDEDMTAHVGDFGLAKIINAQASRQCFGGTSSIGIKGTIGYLAPEYGMGSGVSIEGDVFSYGVLLLEILTGRRPTDASIHDALSLPKFVEMAYPDKLLEIMDTKMLHNGNAQDIIEMYLAPVSTLGLACCRDSARQRPKMSEVVKELSALKEACAHKFSPFVKP